MNISSCASNGKRADFLLQFDEIARMPRALTNSTNLDIFVTDIFAKLIRHSGFIRPQLVHIG
jgi:hypothetical protein